MITTRLSCTHPITKSKGNLIIAFKVVAGKVGLFFININGKHELFTGLAELHSTQQKSFRTSVADL